jgi:hypothetical protein
MEVALLDHLRYNHYPPLPGSLVKPCIDAIAKADQEEWDAEIAMPEGLLFRGQGSATAAQIVESCHLHEFLSLDEEGHSQ